MGLRDRIAAMAARRKANKKSKDKSDYSHKTEVAKSRELPAEKRVAQKTVTVSKRTGGERVKSTPTVKRRAPKKPVAKLTRSEQAKKFREDKAYELKAARASQVKEQKAVTARKKATPSTGPDYSKRKPREKRKPLYGDTRSPDAIARGNTRATANRKNKGAVKKGEKYTYTDSKGNKKQIVKR